jgi:hypothetical protein
MAIIAARLRGTLMGSCDVAWSNAPSRCLPNIGEKAFAVKGDFLRPPCERMDQCSVYYVLGTVADTFRNRKHL